MAKRGFAGKRVFDNMGNDLFGSQPTSPNLDRRIGRSPDMIMQRNERLVARLYWYRTYKSHLRNEFILERLHLEFDLERSTIPQILANLTSELARVKKEAPSIEELKKKWEWMVWE